MDAAPYNEEHRKWAQETIGKFHFFFISFLLIFDDQQQQSSINNNRGFTSNDGNGHYQHWTQVAGPTTHTQKMV